MSEDLIAFKGFDANLSCRGFQFEVGQSYEHSGPVKACESGFHAVEYSLDVFGYYPPSDSRFCTVSMSGEISRGASDSKVAAAKLTVVAEIGIPGIVSHAVRWILDRIDSSKAQTATNTGYLSAATNTGDLSAATNTGDLSAATNTGDQSAATNTGYRSAATNTGYRSAATNTGDRSAATNTGDQSAATNTGDQSAATNTGDRSAATVSGKNSVAIATGFESKAAASIGGAIVICHRDGDMKITHIFASLVGQNGIEPNTFYSLDAVGVPYKVGDATAVIGGKK